MATPRRPYVMGPLGTVENAIAAGASPSSELLLLRIWTHRDKRSIPGLLRSGPAGLSETLNVDRYQLAWSRLPKPFAAAAASDLSAAGKRFSVEAFDGLVKALACSKWVTGEGGLKVTPTLRVLLIQRGYADRIIRGEFADLHSRWRCPDCDTDHAPTGDCPPPCRACQRPHAHGFVCTRAMEMEARERTNAERSPDPFVEAVAKVGFREAMRQKASA